MQREGNPQGEPVLQVWAGRKSVIAKHCKYPECVPKEGEDRKVNRGSTSTIPGQAVLAFEMSRIMDEVEVTAQERIPGCFRFLHPAYFSLRYTQRYISFYFCWWFV